MATNYRIEATPNQEKAYALFDKETPLFSFDYIHEALMEAMDALAAKKIPSPEAEGFADFMWKTLFDGWNKFQNPKTSTSFSIHLIELNWCISLLSQIKDFANMVTRYGDIQAPALLLCKNCGRHAEFLLEPLEIKKTEGSEYYELSLTLSKSFMSKEDGRDLWDHLIKEHTFTPEKISQLYEEIDLLPWK